LVFARLDYRSGKQKTLWIVNTISKGNELKKGPWIKNGALPINKTGQQKSLPLMTG